MGRRRERRRRRCHGQHTPILKRGRLQSPHAGCEFPTWGRAGAFCPLCVCLCVCVNIHPCCPGEIPDSWARDSASFSQTEAASGSFAPTRVGVRSSTDEECTASFVGAIRAQAPPQAAPPSLLSPAGGLCGILYYTYTYTHVHCSICLRGATAKPWFWVR